MANTCHCCEKNHQCWKTCCQCLLNVSVVALNSLWTWRKPRKQEPSFDSAKQYAFFPAACHYNARDLRKTVPDVVDGSARHKHLEANIPPFVVVVACLTSKGHPGRELLHNERPPHSFVLHCSAAYSTSSWLAVNEIVCAIFFAFGRVSDEHWQLILEECQHIHLFFVD